LQNDGNDSAKADGLRSNTFSLLHINARSINNKIDDFTQFIQNFAHKFSCIVVTETWLTAGSLDMNLPGYKCCIVERAGKRGRGVAIQVAESLCFISRHDLFVENSYDIDFACVQISNENSKMLVIGLYHPPNSDLHKFNEFYNDLLEKLPKESVIIA
jgi:hypothetical protein